MSDLYDLIIIGGGPAGCSAGIYAGRANLRTMILDQSGSGGQIRITSEVVNYPGISSISGDQLMQALKEQVKSFGVTYRQNRVSSIETENAIKVVRTDSGDYRCLSVILATGAVPRAAGFKGEETFKGRGVGYCATCDGQFFTGSDIFVIGGGFAAAEEALFLTRYARKVHVIVRKPQFACSETIAAEVLNHEKIQVHFNTRLLAAEGESSIEKAVLINDETGKTWTFASEDQKPLGIFVFTGYEPVSEIVQDKVHLDENKYIVTDEDLRTNLEGIYAAGDIRPKKLRQLVTAVSDGAVAATNAEKYINEVKKSLNLDTKPNLGEATEQMGESHGAFSPDLIQQLAPVLAKFERQIFVAAVIDGQEGLSAEMKTFLDEFGSLTENVKIATFQKGENPQLEEKINAERFPVMAILNEKNDYSGIKYYGVPNGHEFTSFVIALYNIAGPGQEIDEKTSEILKKVQQPLNIKVGVSLTCTMCPDVVMAAQLLAAKNPYIEAEMIDVMRFDDFKTAHNIMSVPAIVIGDGRVQFGKKTLPELLELIVKAI